jgi:preprotein translocase subunit SecG
MLYGILIALQMIISILLVVAILLQSSKGGGLAGIAGGMMSSTVFGGRSAANFLSRATTVLAALFMLNCLGMALISTGTTAPTSVTQQQSATQQTTNSPVPGNGSPSSAPEGQGASGQVPPAQPAK